MSGKSDALFGKESAESTEWFETVKKELLEVGMEPILNRVRQMQSTEPPHLACTHAKANTLRVLENYLVNHSGRMNYRQRLAEGRSIGSGCEPHGQTMVEGACKNLIGARLKQTGARWHEARIPRMGVICSIFYTDQWDVYWNSAQ